MTSFFTLVSHSKVKAPAGVGTKSLNYDMRDQVRPVLRLIPNFIPGKNVSVGKSKLCHKTCWLLEFSSLRTKLPESSKIAVILVAEDRLELNSTGSPPEPRVS